MADFTYSEIATMIDHSLLQPVLTDAALEQGCRLAHKYSVASVCIKPYAVRSAAQLLAGSTVAVGTTIGFPHGGHTTAIKVAEAEQAISDGARELDMVVNVGKVLSKDWRYVADDIHAVIERAHRRQTLVKVIFENCFLADEHKEQLCRTCAEVGADYVKTSTGYGSSGAVDEDLRLMRRCSPPQSFRSLPCSTFSSVRSSISPSPICLGIRSGVCTQRQHESAVRHAEGRHEPEPLVPLCPVEGEETGRREGRGDERPSAGSQDRAFGAVAQPHEVHPPRSEEGPATMSRAASLTL